MGKAKRPKSRFVGGKWEIVVVIWQIINAAPQKQEKSGKNYERQESG